MATVVTCGFCGKSPDDVRTILTSGESAICDECVVTAFETIVHQPVYRYLRPAYLVFTALASVCRLLNLRLWRASRRPPKSN